MSHLNWYDIITGDRRVAPTTRTIVRTQFDIDFGLWRAMVEEPEKFGDDIQDWIELNQKLTSGDGRWRIAAYWNDLEAELIAEEKANQAPWRAVRAKAVKAAATEGMRRWIERDIKRHVARIQNAVVTIQAATRGHVTRNAQPFRNCCICLAHRVCPLETAIGMMCRECSERDDPREPVGVRMARYNYKDLVVPARQYEDEPEW